MGNHLRRDWRKEDKKRKNDIKRDRWQDGLDL